MAVDNKGLLTCVTCGKLYKGCRTCEDARDAGVFMWRQSCDTTECFQVHMVIKDYYNNEVSKEAAKKLLEGIITDEMKPYEPNTRWLIEEIMAESVVVRPVVEPTKAKYKEVPIKNVK